MPRSAHVPERLRSIDGLPSPCAPGQRIRAVLFDLDGTLYRQPPVRALMALELLGASLAGPFAAARRLRVLREYRRAQESMRTMSGNSGHPREQAQVAAERAGVSRQEVEQLADEWMQDRALRHVARWRAAGVIELLDFLAVHGLETGVLSDYPPLAKLRALGVADRFSLVLSAIDVGAFKPDPAGFLAASRRWGLPPSEVLMVGDRLDADAAGAAAAGMPCVVIGRGTGAGVVRPDLRVLPSLERLRNAFSDGR